jgi:hypothetical protein
MALVPDITDIEFSSASDGDIHRGFKEFFDSSITDPANATYINSVSSNHGNGCDAQRFDLVANTNTATDFTINPTTAGVSFHINFRFDINSNTNVHAMIDPQAGVTDAATDPPTLSSSGEPEESPETLFRESSQTAWVTIVEFDDAFLVIEYPSSMDKIDELGAIGKIYNAWFPSFSAFFGIAKPKPLPFQNIFQQNADALYQIEQTTWAGLDTAVSSPSVQKDFTNGNLMPNIWSFIEADLPGVTENRTIGPAQYIYVINNTASSGTRVDGGNTDFAHVGDGAGGTSDEIIPWDANFTPRFS